GSGAMSMPRLRNGSGGRQGSMSGEMSGGRSLDDVAFEDLVEAMLRRLGEDPGRPGLVKTPERVEKSLKWLTRGYHLSVEQVIGDAIFDEDHHDMVVVKDIEMYSMCEHHMLPFFGKV